MKKTALFCLVLMTCLSWAGFAAAAQPSGSSVSVYGRMLTDFGWWNRDKELTNNQTDDVTSAFVNVPGHSYLRAVWASKDKSAGGLVEMGLKSLQPAASVSLRYAYGWWKMGNLKILAGRTDNWFGILAYHARQYLGLNEGSHAYLWGWGQLWPDRVAQLQFTYETQTWGVQFALEDPRDKTAAADVDPYVTLPRLSLTARFKSGGFMTHPGISYVRHSYEDGGNSSEQEYDTWAVILPLRYDIGALSLRLSAHYGINFYQEYPFFPDIAAPVTKQGGDLEDTEILGGFFTVEYKIAASTALIGAVGYERFQNDAWKQQGYEDDTSHRLALVAALHIDINSFFSLHPEFGWYDHGDDPLTGKSQGKEWMLGMQFSWIF
jgi:hypothetical protein